MIVVDLRSDTVTRPTAAMRRAIAEAEVGDAVLGDDPTVRELERRGAEWLGKEAALFFPSGIMANTTALMLHAPPGTEAVIDATGHILNYEEGAAAALAGVQLRATGTPDGLLTPEILEAAIRPRSPYLPRTALVCLENTHNSGGGRVLTAARTRALAGLARALEVAVHLDGARLPNAAVALDIPIRELADPADTVMVALSKGLGAPVGSLLAGDGEIMARAWRIRRRLGGGMRQAGLLAAAGIHAIHNHLGRLADDHRRARMLAAAADGIDGLASAAPDTNIVMVDLADPMLEVGAMLPALEARGVLMTAFGPRRLRAVTHLDIDDGAVEQAVAALRETAAELAAGAPRL